MKKAIISLIFTIVTIISYSQTAPHIIANDCRDVTHNLYDELNQGKVIVIGWAMPCLSCAAPLLEVNNAVLNFAISNLDKVQFWLADDLANTSCSSLETWSNNTGLTVALEFSTDLIKMSDFGSNGMPKVVVIGCDGKVYYNVNNNPTGVDVTSAINSALNEINAGCLTSINENKLQVIELFPNPINDDLVTLSWDKSIEINNVQLINIDGKIIKNFTLNQSSNKIEIDLRNIESGVYELLILDHDKIVDRKKCVKN